MAIIQHPCQPEHPYNSAKILVNFFLFGELQYIIALAINLVKLAKD